MRTRRQALDEFRARIAAENMAAAGVELELEPHAPAPPLVTQGARATSRPLASKTIDDMIRQAASRSGGWQTLE
jgi:hypothetical protein